MLDDLRGQGTRESARAKPAKRKRLDAATPELDDDDNYENLAASKAVLESYKAKLAKLRYERESELLVEVAEVQAVTFRVHRQIREALQNLPDRVASQLAHMSDEADVHQFLAEQIQEVMQNLAEDVYVSL